MPQKFQKEEVTKNLPLQYSFQQQGDICLSHSSPLEFLCFSCKMDPLCGHCLTLNSHQGHDLKNLQRCRQFLRGQLQQWAIRLQSKSEILDVLDEQYFSSRVQFFKSAQRFKQNIFKQLDQIKRKIEIKRKQIFESISFQTNNYKIQAEKQGQVIRLRRKSIQNVINILRQKSISPLSSQIGFYAKERRNIQNLLSQNQITSFKKNIIQPCWGINQQILNNINKSISVLEFTFKDNKKQSFLQKSIKKKVNNSLKKQTTQNQNKSVAAHNYSRTFLASTPKNSSKQKTIVVQKRSPKILKKKKRSNINMFSMPASPSKSGELQSQKQLKKINNFKKK